MSLADKRKTAVVLGAGGFIGSHMVKRLKAEGYWVRGVDLKYPEFSKTEADEFFIIDLRSRSSFNRAIVLNFGEPFSEAKIPDEVYQFAADMGGAGYIFTGEHDADVMHNSASININLLDILRVYKFKGRVFYSSSACMYPQELQTNSYGRNAALAERMAYPANPDSEYGWEKLFSERLYLAYARNYGIDVRIARFHNIYGPEGTYRGGKEKAPAAMCRKVIETVNNCIAKRIKDEWDYRLEIEVWGKGTQTRSFLYIDDCIDAVRLLMQSDFKNPINIGSEESISINELAELAISFSNKRVMIKNIPGPVGVNGRNSDNTLIREVLKWEPKYTISNGLKLTFDWIKSQYERNV
jgi:nucleoside-diphosphate-sugar epimerase